MRVEIKLLAYLAPFFTMMTLIYGFWTGWDELVGVTALALTALMVIFISGYLALTARRIDPRPEDNLEGEQADLQGDLGFFSPQSWWPLWLGLASAVLFAGVAVGWWMVIIAVPFAALAVVGWTFEYFKGEFADQ